MKKPLLLGVLLCVCCMVVFAGSAQAESAKKGLLVHNSIYGSTIEAAYWVRALIGIENHLDVKALSQVITIEPYDYVILGSLTRNEGPTKPMYEFVDRFRADLAKKDVCFFLVCGDTDETMVLKVPGRAAHLIAGRNYLIPFMEKYPDIPLKVIGGFGGRQVMPYMGTMDGLQIWLVGKLAKEGAPWDGLDIWESLVPERVEAFANEVRAEILGLEPRTDVERYRGYWQSLQPASLDDPSKVKFVPKPFTEVVDTPKIYYSRSRITGDLDLGIALLQQWARAEGIELRQQVKTFYNVYYHAVKTYDGREIPVHLVAATLPDDPGNVHFSFRCYEKPDRRAGAAADIQKAEALLWADGRKVQ